MKFFSGKRDKEHFLEEAMPHMDSLFRTAFRISGERSQAEDLVQETYKEAWRSFHRYEKGSNCKAWLFKILFRIRGKQNRHSSRMREVGMEEVPQDRLAVDSEGESRFNSEGLVGILESLPEHYRVVLILADVENLSYREISDSLGLPLGTVMSRLNRARRILREKLLEHRDQTRSA